MEADKSEAVLTDEAYKTLQEVRQALHALCKQSIYALERGKPYAQDPEAWTQLYRLLHTLRCFEEALEGQEPKINTFLLGEEKQSLKFLLWNVGSVSIMVPLLGLSFLAAYANGQDLWGLHTGAMMRYLIMLGVATGLRNIQTAYSARKGLMHAMIGRGPHAMARPGQASQQLAVHLREKGDLVPAQGPLQPMQQYRRHVRRTVTRGIRRVNRFLVSTMAVLGGFLSRCC